MLCGNLEHLELTPYLPKKIVQFINETKVLLESDYKEGRNELSEEGVFVMLVKPETLVLEKCRPEIHAKYLDVQVVLKGEESIGYGCRPVTKLKEDLLDESDVAFSEDIREEKLISLNQGDFAIFYPGEVHRPLVATNDPCTIQKAIIKIPQSIVESK
jgi:biofilm protein TabA